MTVSLLYYTCNTHPAAIEQACREQITRIRTDQELITVSLQPIDFGDANIVLPLKRGPITMHQQIWAGLQRVRGDYVFFLESDVLYHPSHLTFTPARDDVFSYNEHTYKVDAESGRAVFYYTKQVSGLCASRALLLDHYAKRLERFEREGKYDRSIGFEPGCNHYPRGIDATAAERWMSEWPNVDIRHRKTMTLTRWDPAQFRNKNTCLGWTEVDSVPGWGRTLGRFNEFLADVGRVPAEGAA